MTINIDIEYVTRIEEENKELNEFINHVKELSNYHERKKLEYKEENEKLKTKLYDATVKEQRLIKILKETSY